MSNEAGGRRSTWMTGGALLLAAAPAGLLLPVAAGGGLGWIPALLLLAGAVVLAVGLDPSGSVTARRPLGTTAIIVFAAAHLLGALVPLLAQRAPTADPAAAAASGALVGSVGLALALIELAAGIVAVVRIRRAGVVPRPWSLAPLWALVVGTVAGLVGFVGPIAASFGGGRPDAAAWASVTGVADAIAVGFLGVVAIVLALRGRSAPTAEAPAAG